MVFARKLKQFHKMVLSLYCIRWWDYVLSVLEHQTLYIFSWVVSILYFTVLKSYITVMRSNNGKNSTNEDESFKCMFDFMHLHNFPWNWCACQPLMFFVHLMLFVPISLHDQLWHLCNLPPNTIRCSRRVSVEYNFTRSFM